MALSDTKIRGTKAFEKQIKLFDGGGLFLLVARVSFAALRKPTIP